MKIIENNDQRCTHRHTHGLDSFVLSASLRLQWTRKKTVIAFREYIRFDLRWIWRSEKKTAHIDLKHFCAKRVDITRKWQNRIGSIHMWDSWFFFSLICVYFGSINVSNTHQSESFHISWYFIFSVAWTVFVTKSLCRIELYFAHALLGFWHFSQTPLWVNMCKQTKNLTFFTMSTILSISCNCHKMNI